MSETTPEQARAALEALLNERLAGGPAADWLSEQDPARGLDDLRPQLGAVTRAVGRKGLIASFAARADASVSSVWGEVPVGSWSVADAARVILVARAAELEEDAFAALFRAYDAADTEGRVACLRALNFTRPGETERGLELVRDAGRTYLPELLGGAWSGNPFSARHLSDHDYRKAVLKAFFCDVPVEGFLRLEERADAELAKSLCEYVDERLAAGRTVPRAIWPLAALHPRPGLVARLIGMLEHPDREERLVAAKALSKARDARATSFLSERREREDDAEIRAALDAALSVLNPET